MKARHIFNKVFKQKKGNAYCGEQQDFPLILESVDHALEVIGKQPVCASCVNKIIRILT